MKLTLNPSAELFRWGPVEFRLLYGAWWQTILCDVTKYYAWPWPEHALFFENGRMVYITDQKKLYATGEKYFKHYFLNKKNYNDHWRRYEQWVARFNAFEADFRTKKLSKISDQELLRHFKLFSDIVKDFWLIVHVPEIVNWGGEAVLKRWLNKIDEAHFDEYLEILAAPKRASFFQQEEIDLLRLAQSPKSCQPALLKEHAQKYKWLLNSYGGDRILGVNYFRRQLKELTRHVTATEGIANIEKRVRSSEHRKQALAKKLGLNNKVIFAAEQLNQSIWWQDQRKADIWRYQGVL